eukprot:PhF_6_TR2601/c0_g1_i1/m.4396
MSFFDDPPPAGSSEYIPPKLKEIKEQQESTTSATPSKRFIANRNNFLSSMNSSSATTYGATSPQRNFLLDRSSDDPVSSTVHRVVCKNEPLPSTVSAKIRQKLPASQYLPSEDDAMDTMGL